MDIEKFTRAYTESRNGVDHFYRHQFVPHFHFSNGVAECGDAGMYWLIDIAATELRTLIPYGDLGILKFTVTDGKGDLRLELQDDVPPVWERHIHVTDMPERKPNEEDGTGDAWIFLIANEGERVAMILPKEW